MAPLVNLKFGGLSSWYKSNTSYRKTHPKRDYKEHSVLRWSTSEVEEDLSLLSPHYRFGSTPTDRFEGKADTTCIGLRRNIGTKNMPLRFQASGDAEIKTVPRHFARANQADRCITLLHCAHRLTPWLLDTRGCERKVECFSLFEHYVTLPVGTWLIALEQSFRSHYNRLLRTSQSHYFVLRGKRNKLFRW